MNKNNKKIIEKNRKKLMDYNQQNSHPVSFSIEVEALTNFLKNLLSNPDLYKWIYNGWTFKINNFEESVMSYIIQFQFYNEDESIYIEYEKDGWIRYMLFGKDADIFIRNSTNSRIPIYI
ncbi:MAG: hypothetical protein GF329_08645 [Candidatus Lokiarchaeota archaeon]|nr:hypothetical protein [Candidatus Lokiarchaeota archaeon]